MKRSRILLRTVGAGLLLVGLAAGPAAQGVNPEEIARRHYELGLGFMRDQKYTEALKDFQAVVDSYPSSSVAGDALVQIATYQLEIARDVEAAQATTDVILKKYAATPAAATAYVLSGRIAFEKGRAQSDLDTALASFDRVPGLFPTSDVVPAAIFYAGESLRLVRQYDKALDRFRDISQRYPTSTWSARALLGSARCLVNTGRPIPATTALQRVRNQFQGTKEAATALKWNTVLYRLYVRPPAQPAFTFSGRFVGSATAKFKDVVGVALDRNDNVMLAHKSALLIFDPTGNLTKSYPADDPSMLALDLRGAPILARQNVLVTPGTPKTVAISITQPDGRVKTIDDIRAAAVLTRGDLLIGDRKANVVQLFSAAGKHLGQFASFAADRLVLGDDDTVAMLSREDKAVAIVDRDGKPLGRITARGQGYQFDDPVDIGFDALGHLYVLDRGLSTVFVFTPQGRLVVSFSVPEKNAGTFQKAVALGLDSAGRLYIFDDRVQRVQIYQ